MAQNDPLSIAPGQPEMASEVRPPDPPATVEKPLAQDNTPEPKNTDETLSLLPSSASLPKDDGSMVSWPEKLFRIIPLLGLSIVGFIWASFDNVVIPVKGQAILMQPRTVIPIQSRAAGKVLAIKVKPGETVQPQQILMVLDLPDLYQALANEQQKLSQLQTENQALLNLEQQRARLTQETLSRQTQAILREMESLEAEQMANLNYIASQKTRLEANAQQNKAYRQRIEQLQSINQLIHKRQIAYQNLSEEGIIASLSPDLIRAIQAEQDNRNTVTTLMAKVEDNLASNKAEHAKIKQLLATNQNIVAQLKNKNSELENLKAQLEQVYLENKNAEVTRNNAIQDQRRAIAQIKRQIATDSLVLSAGSGKILDVAVNSSQYVQAGQTLGNLEVKSNLPQNIGLAFYAVKDADRIQPGMRIEVIPSMHSRERYGGIIGKVLPFDSEPKSEQEIASLVGDPKLAATLTRGEAIIQIPIELQTANTISGYQWTWGQGVPQKIPPAATANTRVIVEKRSLFSYLDILRNFTGIYHK